MELDLLAWLAPGGRAVEMRWEFAWTVGRSYLLLLLTDGDRTIKWTIDSDEIDFSRNPSDLIRLRLSSMMQLLEKKAA